MLWQRIAVQADMQNSTVFHGALTNEYVSDLGAAFPVRFGR